MTEKISDTITIKQHYSLLRELNVHSINYTDIPVKLDGEKVDHEDYFNVMQKEIHAYAIIYLN